MTSDPNTASPRRVHTGTPIPEPEVPAGVEVIRDVAFGPHERQSYDVYLPHDAARPLPVVVFFHPGAWTRRDKRAVRTMFVLEHGFALVSIGYRLAQHAPFPAQIQDANAGLRHLIEHADTYGIDTTRMVVAGTSAGAHLGTLTVLAKDVPEFAPVPGFNPRGMVAIYGAYDLPDMIANQDEMEIDHSGPDSALALMIGGDPAEHPEALKQMSPQTYVRPDAPPFYVLHGVEDIVLPWAQSADFAASLARAGVAVNFETVQGAGHGHELFRTAPVSDRIMAFIADVASRKSGS